MHLSGMLVLGFSIWMAVESYRRGQAMPWMWIILLLQPIGGIIYFVLEVQTVVDIKGMLGMTDASGVRFRKHRVSGQQLQQARADVTRLDNAAAWSDYAALLRAKSKHREAAEAAANALERDPADIHSRYELGRALIELGKHPEAAKELQAVVDEDAGFDYGDAMLGLAKCREALNQIDAAKAAYEQVAVSSSRPDVLYRLAAIQDRTGERAAAAATLQKIVDSEHLGPDFAQQQAAPWVRRARKTLKSLGHA